VPPPFAVAFAELALVTEDPAGALQVKVTPEVLELSGIEVLEHVTVPPDVATGCACVVLTVAATTLVEEQPLRELYTVTE
jgi:hypothetical protein